MPFLPLLGHHNDIYTTWDKIFFFFPETLALYPRMKLAQSHYR